MCSRAASAFYLKAGKVYRLKNINKYCKQRQKVYNSIKVKDDFVMKAAKERGLYQRSFGRSYRMPDEWFSPILPISSVDHGKYGGAENICGELLWRTMKR